MATVRCPRCNNVMEKAIAFNGAPSEFWYACTSPVCNAYYNSYEPQPHQAAVHNDPHRFIGNFGGFGTGKTLTSRQELYKHIFLTPNANILIGANVASQYEQTIKREIEADIPAAFVTDYSNQKSYMDLINGARIMYRPFDDPDKLRSYNLTMFIIIEASETSAEVFTQLKTRLRNLSATIPQRDENGEIVMEKDDEGKESPILLADWRRGIIESNPGSGWIRSDVLYYADKITNHGKALEQYYVPEEEKDPSISVHVASSDVNKYLPKSFIPDMQKNKPAWWVARYIYSSFAYAEGLVYPNAEKCIVPTFPIPKDWKRLAAFDYGLSDTAAFIWLAIDEAKGVVYVYQESRATDRNVEELAKIFKTGSMDIPIGGWYTAPFIDPMSGARRSYNKESLIDLMKEQGIYFQPGVKSVDARVFRVNTYMESGKLKIMDCCKGLITELRDYKFQMERGSEARRTDKPVDKNNHSINAMEWPIMSLPADPGKLLMGAYDGYGRDITQPEKQQTPWLPHALSDTNNNSKYEGAYGSSFSIMDF